MATLYVQFTSPAKTSIQGFFAGPQEDGVYENYGTVDSSSDEWRSYYQAMQSIGMATGLPNPD